MKYIKTFNNHKTYELNLLVDYPTLSHCQTEEHIHLTPKYFIRYKAEDKIPGGYNLMLGCFGDTEIIDHIFNKKEDEEYGTGIIICNKPITEFAFYPFFNPSVAIELDIPDTLEEINEFFSGSSTDHVKRIIFRSLIPPTLGGLNIFDHYWDGINTHLAKLYPYLKIYVPDNSVDAYKTATNWSTYRDIIFPISQLSQDLEEDEEEDEEED